MKREITKLIKENTKEIYLNVLIISDKQGKKFDKTIKEIKNLLTENGYTRKINGICEDRKEEFKKDYMKHLPQEIWIKK